MRDQYSAIVQRSRKVQDDSQKYTAEARAKYEQRAEETHKLTMDLLAKQELRAEESHKQVVELMKRQQDDVARYEKILATWERQQAQYQKYLDSLPAATPAK